MAATLVTRINRYEGTASEMAALDVTGVPVGSTFLVDETGLIYSLTAAGAWIEKKSTVSLSSSNTRVQAKDTITIGTGAAHSAGDVVSTDAGKILEFETGLAAGGSGIILDSLATLGQNAVFAAGAGYTLYLFNAAPTVQATNAVFDIVDADLPKYIGKIDITALVDIGSNCISNDIGHNLSFTLASGDTKLYGKLVAKGGETTVTGKVLTINLGIAAL